MFNNIKKYLTTNFDNNFKIYLYSKTINDIYGSYHIDKNKYDEIFQKLSNKESYHKKEIELYKLRDMELIIENGKKIYLMKETISIINENNFIGEILKIHTLNQYDFPLIKNYDVESKQNIIFFKFNVTTINLINEIRNNENYYYIYIEFDYKHNNEKYILEDLNKLNIYLKI